VVAEDACESKRERERKREEDLTKVSETDYGGTNDAYRLDFAE